AVAVALDPVGRRDPGGGVGLAVPHEDVGAGRVGAGRPVGVARHERRGVGPEGDEPAVGADRRVGADDAAAVGAGGLAAPGLDAGLVDGPGLQVLHVDVGVAAGIRRVEVGG